MATDLLGQHWIRVAFVDEPVQRGLGYGFNASLVAGLEIAAIIHAGPTAPSLPALLVMIERVPKAEVVGKMARLRLDAGDIALSTISGLLLARL